MEIKGIHHIQLTVLDLERSKSFYSKLPGFKIVAEYDHFIMFFCKTFYLGLTDHSGKQLNKKFAETNIGLDHIAFEVSSKKDLKEASEWLEKENIPHGEIKELSNGTHVLAFRDPDNIQLEFASKK
jgi:glyoxylase I family protein